MKNIITLILLFTSFNFFGQKKKSYVFNRVTIVTPYKISTDKGKEGDKETEKKLIAQSGWKFNIDHEIPSGKIITFWNFRDKDENLKGYYGTYNYTLKKQNIKDKDTVKEINVDDEKIYFFIDNDTFLNHVIENKNDKVQFVFGTTTIPIRVRPRGSQRFPEKETAEDTDDSSDELPEDFRAGRRIRQFNLASGVNIGATIGFKLKVIENKELFLTPIFGINLIQQKINNNELTENLFSDGESSDILSFSPVVGLVLDIKKTQIGFLLGWDKLGGNVGEKWVYQGRVWYGIGIGVNIFSTNLTKRNSKQ